MDVAEVDAHRTASGRNTEGGSAIGHWDLVIRGFFANEFAKKPGYVAGSEVGTIESGEVAETSQLERYTK